MDAGVDGEGAAYALRIAADVARRGGQGSGEIRRRDAGSWHQHDMASSESARVGGGGGCRRQWEW
jgi:hypothetical protein